MEYQEFVDKSDQADALGKDGHLKEAVDAFYQLVLSDISEIDKADLCIKLADIYDRLGNTDEALGWYDKGIAYEEANCRYAVREQKALFLSARCMYQDAIRIYEQTIKQPYLSEKERDRLRRSMQSLLGKSLGEWR